MGLKLKLTVLILAMAAMAGGCADDRPSYVAPTLTDSEAATMVGGMGYYISEVDGYKVDSAFIQMSLGGNAVKLMPGNHDFVVSFFRDDGMFTKRGMWHFSGVVKAGHHYKLGSESLMNTNLAIRDIDIKGHSTDWFNTSPAGNAGSASSFPGD